MLHRHGLRTLAVLCGFCLMSAHAQTPRTPIRVDAKVFFRDLKDGATVPSKLTVHFGASNLENVPAASAKPDSGHHHLIIDSPVPSLDAPIPSDPLHLHFGRGQTEAEIILPAGEHTLQLILGDHAHVPHNPPVVSEPIHVKVDPATVERPRSVSPPGASVAFAGLEDGAVIPTTSTVKFAIAGMELVAAGTAKPGGGHHHLVVDQPLPEPGREIPSDPGYIHFGRGQTETQLTLAPGPHTLQLLLGDHDHIPHDPPVASKLIHVTVAGKAAAPTPAAAAAAPGRTPSPPDAAVYFIYPSNGETIFQNSTIRFGLRNMGVAPAGVEMANTGHHHLIVDAATPAAGEPIASDPHHLHFGAGQTEIKINLPPGKHTLQLFFGDQWHVPHDPPVMSAEIEVTVMGSKKGRRR